MTQSLTNTNKFYTYGHYRKDTGRLFYVGKGTGRRAWSKHGRNSRWKNIANKHGFDVFIFRDSSVEQDAFELEKQLIIDLSPEANMTKGGEGGGIATYGFKGKRHSDLRNKNLSKLFKGRRFRKFTEADKECLRRNAAAKSKAVIDQYSGMRYVSIREASRVTGISKTCIIKYLKMNKRFMYDVQV